MVARCVKIVSIKTEMTMRKQWDSAALNPNSTWLVNVSKRHDAFDVSSSSCRAVLFDKLDTANMHGLDTSYVSWRVETSQVQLGL